MYKFLHLQFILDPIYGHIYKIPHVYRIFNFALNLVKIFGNLPWSATLISINSIFEVFPKSNTGILKLLLVSLK